MNAKVLTTGLFSVISFIASTPIRNQHNSDTCVFKNGQKKPTFM